MQAGRAVGEYKKAVADYKNGKRQALNTLIGAILKNTNGAANPARAREAILEEIGHEDRQTE
jgi:Asp-tRNA(Asn)/Glu-tRNA(Gln) amidotransferase B subunit